MKMNIVKMIFIFFIVALATSCAMEVNDQEFGNADISKIVDYNQNESNTIEESGQLTAEKSGSEWNDLFEGVENKGANDARKSKLHKFGELKLDVPEAFTTRTYKHPEYLKFAFIEIENDASEGFELSDKAITPFLENLKKIFEEISEGNTKVDMKYKLLPKKKVNVTIEDAIDPNLNNIVKEILKENSNLNADILFIIVDAKHSFYGAANHDDSEEGISPIVMLSGLHFNFLKSKSKAEVDRLLLDTTYAVIHEMLHSYEFGRANDAYRDINMVNQKYPFVNLYSGDLFGLTSHISHPFGPLKVLNGWKKYDIIKYELDKPVKFNVKNTCLKDAVIPKIPIGYAFGPQGTLLFKSIVFDLIGKNRCQDENDPAGLHVYEIYESYDRVEYTYDLPFVQNPATTEAEDAYVFALDYYGNNYAILNGINPKPFKEYSDDHFSIKILDEEKNNGNLDGIDVEFTVKKKEALDRSLLGETSIEIFNYDDKALLFKVKIDENKIKLPFRILINQMNAFYYNVEYPTNVFCIMNDSSECGEIIKEEFGEKIYAASSIWPLEKAFETCRLEIALNNNVAVQSLVVKNFFKREC
ncbi:TPA: hypothetical protein HA246_04000 [Candidatus Woesearchaeota archaeon]|nr:hypothetical protein [Candidatus Woesearchaeota archaeon]